MDIGLAGYSCFKDIAAVAGMIQSQVYFSNHLAYDTGCFDCWSKLCHVAATIHNVLSYCFSNLGFALKNH